MLRPVKSLGFHEGLMLFQIDEVYGLTPVFRCPAVQFGTLHTLGPCLLITVKVAAQEERRGGMTGYYECARDIECVF